MLARSAERLYWLGRYLERTENTARLLSVYMNLMFDLPDEHGNKLAQPVDHFRRHPEFP